MGRGVPGSDHSHRHLRVPGILCLLLSFKLNRFHRRDCKPQTLDVAYWLRPLKDSEPTEFAQLTFL